MRRTSVLAALPALACLFVSSSARADGDGSFSQLLREQGRGYGLSTAGVGLAGRMLSAANSVSVTEGTLKLTGIPAGATIRSAHLYWVIYGGTVDTQVSINGVAVTGQLIGTVGDTCWPNQAMYQVAGQNNRVYRADVKARITGNGDYVITEFPTGPGDSDTQGAGLVVVYEDAADTATGTVIVQDGAHARFPSEPDVAGTFDGFTPGKLVSSSLRFGAADGQSGPQDGDVEWNGDPLPKALGGPWANSSGRYWDDRVYDLTTVLDLTKPSGTWKAEDGSDCVVLAYAALAYRVEGPSNPMGDAGPSDGGSSGGSSGGGGSGGPSGDGGPGTGTGDADGGDNVIAAESTPTDSGCGCGVVGTHGAGGAAAVAAIGLALARRRRRRS